jgi:ribosomal protein S18 acetylase RimI-like enzyme
MILQDWRDVGTEELAPFYAAECRRYRDALQWDFEPSCRIIEEARRVGRLPGLVVRTSGGRIAGWSYFVVHDGVLQIGGLAADSASRLRALLDGVLQSAEARFSRSLTAFVFPGSPSLQAAFERQRFAIEPHAYLARPIVGGPRAESVRKGLAPEYRLRPLSEVDPAEVVRLAARSYAGMAESRCFAPDGRLDQWAQYLRQLLATPACGWYLSAASFAVEHRETRVVAGAIVSTALAPETAHVAQIVVSPPHRRAGLAAELVAAALERAREDGYATLSLLVAQANAPARNLYARLGFTETASFLFARRAALTRRAVPPVLTGQSSVDPTFAGAR